MFLKSISVSIKDAIIANPNIQKFVRKHPAIFAFIKKRFNADKFFGLPLTLLLIVFICILAAFLETIRDIAASNSLIGADIRVANLMYAFRDTGLIKTFLWITVLAKWQTVVSFAIITSLVLWLWKKRLYILPLWISIIGSYLFCTLTKIIIHRPRPAPAYYLETGYSFPSGHATMAVAFYGFITYVLFSLFKRWKNKTNILFIGLLIILGIGLSRIYLGVHYLSDVWGGYLLGALWLIIGIGIAEWLKKRNPLQRISASPSIKTLSIVLPLVGFIFYVGFALQYNPRLNEKTAPSAIVIASNIQDVFQKNNLPKYTETLIGDNQQPISLVVVAKGDKEFVGNMQKSGWILADALNFGSMLKLAKTALFNQNYPTAPTIPSFWNVKVDDFGFEKPTKAQSVHQRHHARFWKTDIRTSDGQYVYVGTVHLDTGIKWLITHKIASDIDTGRELLFADLKNSGVVLSSQRIQSVPPGLGQNFSGDQFFTDGKLYIINLK